MEHYKNSELCQKCANCCKSWWFYTDLKDDAIRVSWLDTDKISVIKVREGLWKITFNIPCTQLIEKEGLYYCKVYNGLRPEYCKTYPSNCAEEVKEFEKKTCPALRC